MKPKPSSAADTLHLFQAHFKQLLDLEHSLCRLADEIDWSQFDESFQDCYSPTWVVVAMLFV